MRFLIVTYDEPVNIPYMEKYERQISENGGELDVIFWDRRGCIEQQPKNVFLFRASNGKTKLSKIFPFIKWSLFVRRQLRKGKYDRLIVLTTLPAILLYDRLIGAYRKRYVLDIRDYTYEGIGPYRRMVHRLVECAQMVFISSKAFMGFLCQSPNIYVTHNISNGDKSNPSCTLDLKATKPLTIGFVGGIRYYEENKQLLLQLKNNDRYFMEYVGKTHPGCDLHTFCIKENVDNVAFKPAYVNEQKPHIYQSIDLINAIYGSQSPEVCLALPNKLYDCVLFKKPILVSKGTYLAELVERYRLGLPVDLDSGDLATQIDAYLAAFDRERFEQGCAAFLRIACQEEALAMSRIKEYCCGEEAL